MPPCLSPESHPAGSCCSSQPFPGLPVVCAGRALGPPGRQQPALTCWLDLGVGQAGVRDWLGFS